MIQLFDKLPPDLLGGGMIYCDSGEYCRAGDAQRILNKAYAQVDFLQGNMDLVWYLLPPEIETFISDSVVYCNATQAQQLLDKLTTKIEFLFDQIPIVGKRATFHKPVRC